MHYQISRDGQMYGPYTLEDLKRYLASGNVLPNDLAKSETMADWLPVEQILAQAAVSGTPVEPAAAYQPVGSTTAANANAYRGLDYGQPMMGTAAQGQTLAASPYPDAPNLHWGLVLLFAILTGGIFMIIWNLVIAAWVKRVQPNATSLYYYAGFVVFKVINWIVVLPHTLSTFAHPHGLHTGGIGGFLFWLVAWVLKLIWRFSQRTSLEEHFNGPEPVGLRLDSIMTFFFGGLYFQAKLNEVNEMKQRARFSSQRPY
jgi:hypothetical protein